MNYMTICVCIFLLHPTIVGSHTLLCGLPSKPYNDLTHECVHGHIEIPEKLLCGPGHVVYNPLKYRCFLGKLVPRSANILPSNKGIFVHKDTLETSGSCKVCAAISAVAMQVFLFVLSNICC